MKPSVAIAVFSYRALNMEVFHSLTLNLLAYGTENVHLVRTARRTEIHRDRSMVANAFLKTKWDYLLMIDDDMLLPSGHEHVFSASFRTMGNTTPPPNAGSVCALSRIMSHGPEIKLVGGLYVSRNGERNPMVFDANVEPKHVKDGTASGLHKCQWVATGFLRIHRSVFESLIEATPTTFPEIKPVGQPGHPGHYYGFFLPRQHRGEDASFFDRTNRLKIQCYVDMDIKLGHIGEYIYAPGQ